MMRPLDPTPAKPTYSYQKIFTYWAYWMVGFGVCGYLSVLTQSFAIVVIRTMFMIGMQGYLMHQFSQAQYDAYPAKRALGQLLMAIGIATSIISILITMAYSPDMWWFF